MLAGAQYPPFAISACRYQSAVTIPLGRLGKEALFTSDGMANRRKTHLSNATSSVARGTSSEVTSSSTRSRIARVCALVSARSCLPPSCQSHTYAAAGAQIDLAIDRIQSGLTSPGCAALTAAAKRRDVPFQGTHWLPAMRSQSQDKSQLARELHDAGLLLELRRWRGVRVGNACTGQARGLRPSTLPAKNLRIFSKYQRYAVCWNAVADSAAAADLNHRRAAFAL